MAANWQRGVLKAMGVKNHPVEVVGVTDITPWYRRIRFSAPGFLDELEVHPTVWLRLWVPSLTRAKVVQRGYTILEPDSEAAEFSLDFVLHEPTGPAAAWAKDARPGTRAEVAHTPQRLSIDPATRLMLLLGDTTALPAIATLIRAAPDAATKHVVIMDDHPDHHLLPLNPDARTTVLWARPDPTGASLVGALQESLQVDVTQATYLWAAGERKLVKAVREYARGPLALERHQQHTQNYWIFGHDAG
ncbi:siderophore-interacting protein [Planctomonas sp. JC2975]|uniref:siderophore-interacting protein n=1 Tax=Planctomonas sp. JC2975 TaxID=2729626 RepID=UPI0014755E44|nr:siderophore-interacting protein [Planctomonas sp. JC2975]NNC10314.1 siderophore-interacting protein [Planctomonas sp. JC2975]